ncbi:homocitrate synthase [Apiospora arundinis]
MHATFPTPVTLAIALIWALSLLASITTAVAIPNPAPAPEPISVSGSFDSGKFHLDINLGDDLANLTTRPVCDQYSFIANYSAIGGNATLRDALMNASPSGADIVTHVADAAMKVADYFRSSELINKMCGNLSAIADLKAASNFSNGIVADQVVGGNGLGAGAHTVSSLVLVTLLSVLVSALVI